MRGTYGLYSQEDEKNIASNKNSEFNLPPRVILQLFYAEMELRLASCAVRKGESFLLNLNLNKEKKNSANKQIRKHKSENTTIDLDGAPVIET